MTNTENNISRLQEFAKDDASFAEIKKIIHQIRQEELINEIKRLPGNSDYFFWEYEKYDKDGNEQIFFSNNVERFIGIPAGQLEKDSKLFASKILDNDLAKVKKTIGAIKNLQSSKEFEVSFRILGKDDKVIWLRRIICVDYNDGNLESVFSVYFNITESVEREEALMNLKEKYRQKNSAKDKFISIVSHDLRAPFTSLLGFSEILLKEENLSPEESREYLEYIYNAAKTELQLINDLLDWSRLQSGKIHLNIARVRLVDVVSNAVSVLTGNAIRKNVQVKINIEDDLFVFADERLLSQAIKNLLSNSIKFTPPGKNIYINTGKFNEGFMEVVIKDEGVGIPEKYQDKIFKIDEKFTLDGTEGEKGSGLGLTLVKEIVEKHDGNIWFYSKENEGTEFHFTLPEAKMRIVVVEDDLMNRKIIVQAINACFENCEIIEASNGYEAISKIDFQTPALIITDHEMPLMNGYQLVEAVKRKFPSSDIPLIIVSGVLTDEIKSQYEKLGVNHIIEKPILPENFGSLIKELVT